ncbi:hypothetical protein E2C01_032332 [Portunus trituberculatus]|uniref:Uncharacterized protein n=1 Tax=Portunus trituberculatus TaxID=210409 RepID=A0A5B7F0G8_PORTR|nr:hypothetical protein [Portunus trituberculatus]
MVDDLLECTGDEEDPFALDRYVDVSRDPTFGHTLQPSQGHTHSPGPASQPATSSSSSRHTPQMGVTALKMIPESKVLKSPESRRFGDSGSRSSSGKQESGSQSPKTHLLDLHLGRRHKRVPSGGQGSGEHANKSSESPNMSPRQNREGAQSPKGIRLDLHITRKHKRSLSGSQSGSETQHNKVGDSPNLSSRPSSARVEGSTHSPKANFLDIHLNHRHKRSSSGGQGMVDFVSDKFGDSPATSTELLTKDTSPTSDKRFISFLKTHIPFVSSQTQSAGLNFRSQASPSSAPEEEAPDAPPKSVSTRHSGHVRHSSESGPGQTLHHQSAPSTPSKMANRHSADLSGPPLRPRSVVVDGNRFQEDLWDL